MKARHTVQFFFFSNCQLSKNSLILFFETTREYELKLAINYACGNIYKDAEFSLDLAYKQNLDTRTIIVFIGWNNNSSSPSYMCRWFGVPWFITTINRGMNTIFYITNGILWLHGESSTVRFCHFSDNRDWYLINANLW